MGELTKGEYAALRCYLKGIKCSECEWNGGHATMPQLCGIPVLTHDRLFPAVLAMCGRCGKVRMYLWQLLKVYLEDQGLLKDDTSG